MNSVSEKIDERILRLLGLDDVFDLDYDTYMTLLKEAIVTGSNKLPEEELAILANERKRVRGKKGRFTPKKEKITADKVATTKLLKGTKVSKKTLALSSTISKPDIQQQDLTGIGKPLESISKTLATLLKFSKKTSEEERRDKETQKRTKREEGLEGFKKGISMVSSAAKKMLAPFQSIIDRIWKFIFFTLLGRAFTQLMGWLGDPKNKRKIEVLGRFLKDWWPTLLGAAVLFFTPFGKFVRGTLKIVGFFAGKLVKAIPQIAKAVAGLGRFAVGHPLLTIGLATGLATGAAEMRRQGEEKKQVESEAKKRGVKPETVKIELEQAKRSPFAMFGEAMQNIGGFVSGGSIPSLGNGYSGIDGSTGQKVSGFGPDTQMIIAQPGEIVMNKRTVDAVGADTFLGLNRQYGGPGANKPKMGRMFNTGGMVGRNPSMEDIMRQAHSTTVRIKGASGGSGVIVRNNNGEYTVLTANHLISPNLLGEELSIITSDGRSHDIKIDKSNTSAIKGVDMATVKFKSDQNYMVARRGDITKIQKGDPTFVGGYPYDPKAGFQDNVLRFSTGQVVDPNSTDDDALKGGQTLRYSNQTQQGMSGGFVFNSRGELIGIHGQSSAKGFIAGSGAVPISAYGGKFGSTDARNPYVNPNLKYLQLSKLQQDKADQTYSNSTGLEADYGGPRGDQYLVGKKSDIDLRVKQGFIKGGLIKENTGMNIRGATADRQRVDLQPGEFVIPKDSVDRLGTSFFEKLVAMTDSNSNAYLGKGTITRPKITPLRRGQSEIMTLPPITQSASGGSVGGGSAAGSKVPAFSASSPSGGAERSMNAGIYGIVG